jgi:hypothetical protein
MSDPLRSPSEAMRGWLSTQRLHWMTWLLILAGALHLAADIVTSIADVARFFTDQGYGSVAAPGRSGAEVVAATAARIGYSLEFFGTAAIVEFLARIWAELQLKRRAEDRPTRSSARTPL